MNTVEYLIKRLEELGITDYFGVPGNYNVNLMNTVESTPDINWIGCTNELNAGYAADGYARQKGFGAFITSYGEGELKAISALAGSYAENIPVIHIAGIPSTEISGKKNFLQNTPCEKSCQSYTEINKLIIKTAALLNKDNAKIEIDRVLKTFIRERKPVYIAIPENIALQKISDKITDYDWLSNYETLTAAVDLIAEKINNSNKPVIIADTLIKRFDAGAAFSMFMNSSRIPVTNLPSGAGIISMDSENYFGTFLADYGNIEIKKYIDESDCIIAVGVPEAARSAFPFDINANISIMGNYTYIDDEKYDDIKMQDILNEISKKVTSKEIQTEKIALGYENQPCNREKLSTDYIYPRLQEFFRGEDIIFAETGTIPYGLAPVKLPENCEYNIQMISDSIGWACPAAFGTAIANPKARVIVITGDGAYQVSALETGSMCRYGVKPIIIIINNGGYSAERMYSGRSESDYNNIMQMDYAKFARAFKSDVWATKVETSDDFDKALRVTQIMDKLCVIEALTDKNDIPELAEEIFSKQPKQKPKKKILNIKPDKKPNKEESLTISDTGNYETSVHVSLKDFED